MNRGYVKLWRKSLDSGFLNNADVWQLLSWCLLRAVYKPHKQLVGKQMVELKPGQVIFGRTKVAQELGTTERKIRTSLELLKKADFLTVETTSKYSIISLINWSTYQECTQQNDQQTTSKVANKCPTNDHKQEYKELKNINNTPLTPLEGGGTILQLSPDTAIEKSDLPPGFGEWWKAYPKKVAKPASIRAWKRKIKEKALPELEVLLGKLCEQKNSEQWQKDNGEFIPHPSTYLNQHRWEDETHLPGLVSDPFEGAI